MFVCLFPFQGFGWYGFSSCLSSAFASGRGNVSTPWGATPTTAHAPSKIFSGDSILKTSLQVSVVSAHKSTGLLVTKCKANLSIGLFSKGISGEYTMHLNQFWLNYFVVFWVFSVSREDSELQVISFFFFSFFSKTKVVTFLDFFCLKWEVGTLVELGLIYCVDHFINESVDYKLK